MVRQFAFIALLLCVLRAAATPADTMTGALNERVRSLQVTDACGMPAQMPVVALNAPAQLGIEFDVLHDDRDYLRYRLVHCDASWRPSALADAEYLDGFNEAEVENWAYSEATSVPYTHYRIDFPTRDMMPRVSGNYLLQVYPENDPDDVWAQMRLLVSEQVATVNADLTSHTDVDYNDARQQLSVAVYVERAGVGDPFNELTLYIQQNDRYDSEVALPHPLRASRTEAVYEHLPQLIFDGGNEYRRFETVSEYYPGMGVESITWAAPYYHYTLAVDEPRAEVPYSYDSTQAGRFMVRRQGASESTTEADYGVVHFALRADEIPGAMVFIDGDLTSRRFDSEALMHYNPATGCYERAMLLKQGSYNYQYLVVPPGARRGYTAPVEGDRYNTRNEYLIKVYHRAPAGRYDRLIAVALIR
ncbi:MAG: DUF5103 domain-containing protein [Muribaculaceae bacterium]|nr:DUF5103 domain-containing protein [Muribaculaceae bacterium]